MAHLQNVIGCFCMHVLTKINQATSTTIPSRTTTATTASTAATEPSRRVAPGTESLPSSSSSSLSLSIAARLSRLECQVGGGPSTTNSTTTATNQVPQAKPTIIQRVINLELSILGEQLQLPLLVDRIHLLEEQIGLVSSTASRKRKHQQSFTVEAVATDAAAPPPTPSPAAPYDATMEFSSSSAANNKNDPNDAVIEISSGDEESSQHGDFASIESSFKSKKSPVATSSRTKGSDRSSLTTLVQGAPPSTATITTAAAATAAEGAVPASRPKRKPTTTCYSSREISDITDTSNSSSVSSMGGLLPTSAAIAAAAVASTAGRYRKKRCTVTKPTSQEEETGNRERSNLSGVFYGQGASVNGHPRDQCKANPTIASLKENGTVVKPNPADVLLGRGGGRNLHPGNVCFRNFVQKYKDMYSALPRGNKMALVEFMYSEIVALDPPVRFLKQNPQSLLWDIIPMEDAKSKIFQTLREDPARGNTNMPLGNNYKLRQALAKIQTALRTET